MPHVLCSVATKGRYDATLAACLQSILAQERVPDALLLIDDNPPDRRADLRRHPVLAQILNAMSMRMKVDILHGPGHGPHANHEIARLKATELVWRVDDDECPMPDVLGRLERFFVQGDRASRCGAACGRVHGAMARTNPWSTSRLDLMRARKTVQWYLWPRGTVMDDIAHCHSSYLYRASAGTFDRKLSPVGHTEETWHTLEMRMSGWDLMFDADALTWHYRQPHGGIRQGSTQEMWAHDERLFNEYCDRLNVPWVMPVDFVASGGLGDMFALREALPSILPQYEAAGFEKRMFARPEHQPIFEDLRDRFDVFLPFDDKGLFHSTVDENIYHHMSRVKWTGGVAAAYVDYYDLRRTA